MIVNIPAKSIENLMRLGKVIDGTRKTRPYFLPLTSKCDFDLEATDLSLAPDTLPDDGQHFCQVIANSIEEWRSCRLDTKTDHIFYF